MIAAGDILSRLEPTWLDLLFWPAAVALVVLARVFRSPAFWALTALGLLLLFNRLFTPHFFQVELREGHLYGSLLDILNRGAPVVLLAMGMTLVIGTAGIDLSVGAVMAIAGALAAGLVARPGYSVLSAIDIGGGLTAVGVPASMLPGAVVGVAIAAALAVALLAGVWNGLLVALLDIQPIVATLILMVAGRGIAQLLTAGQIITFQSPALAQLGGGFFCGVPVPVYLVGGVLTVTLLLARRTALGLFIESVGDNPTASRYAGVNARTVKVLAYAVSGLFAGLAGLILTADIKAADANNTGMFMELDAILAVCIGGTALTGGRFTLLGSLVGALLIQALTTTILTLGIAPEVTLVVKAAVVVGVCLLQSQAFRQMLARRLRRRPA